MSRINTNVSSVIAQKTLARSNADLQVSLTRLSTGLRINVGKDDPAGLIASENLRRDITAVRRAISNSERANQLIATADSALGQVSGLLNDIRGLVTEAANTGALSDEQIAANQLQVDSSLEAIDRIAQVTTFQGRKLLDGSLDFITDGGNNFDQITDLRIDQAFIDSDGIDIDITVSTAATQAQLDTSIDTTGATAASLTFTSAEDGDQLTVTAASTGTAYNDVSVVIEEDTNLTAGDAVVFFDGDDTVTIKINGATDLDDIVTAFGTVAEFTASRVDAGGGDGD